ncbi:MAG TPA: SIS domain-containing protein [Bryobacteraceae bacterium]|jgi:D-sedoheptulose 7-phosphate isomerase|nr:SIS domain-containing protein [Bryobacteraceae bacterium]
MSLAQYLDESIAALERARLSWTEDLVARAVAAMTGTLRAGKPVLVCGNGGSAADAMHLTGELVGRFLVDRKALNVICLAANPAVLSALANDNSYDTVFARQVEAYGQPGAILIGISTSGTSANVVSAFVRARTLGMKTIALTGEGGGKLAALSDYLFAVPSRSTPLIQQVHICLYHYFCQSIEQAFAPEQVAQPLAAVTEP